MAEIYDVVSARKAGLSDGEIASALASRLNYDLEGARKAGIPDSEISDVLVKKFNQSTPLGGENQGRQPPGLRPTPTMLERAGKTVQEAKDAILLRDPGVDYESGVKDFGLRANFGRMSNDAERENYLAQKVGSGNFGKDKAGRYYIHPIGLEKLGIQSGKPIALDESGASRYDVADLVGDAPAVVGATGMAMAGSGLGFFPGIGLAALGAAGGKAFDELAKRSQGYNLQDSGEQAATIAKEGAMGAIGEGVGRGIIGTGRFIANPWNRFGADPERQALVRDALDAGFVPKVFQAQKNASLLGRFQSMGETVLGDRALQQNQAAIRSGINNLESRAGTSAADAGQSLVSGVNRNIEKITQEATAARDRANAGLDQSILNIQQTLGKSEPDVGAIVQKQIKDARTKLGSDAAELYGKVDDLVGGQPIVPTASLKSRLESLVRNLPTDKDGNKIFVTPELKQFYTKYADIGDMQTVRQMQQLRTDFRNAAEASDLVPGFDKYAAGRLKASIDQAFDDAINASSMSKTTLGRVLDADGNAIKTTSVTNLPGYPSAIKALREADEFYKNGIKKFDAPTIAAITRDASQRGAIEPAKVVDSIIKPGYSSAALRIKGLVSPETWKSVQREHFDSLIQDSIQLMNGQETISGATLFKKIQDMGNTFNVVYGPQAGAMRKYAAELAARDGKIDPSTLTGDIANNLRVAVAKDRELKSFLNDNYLSALAKPGTEGTQAADFIFQPKSPARIAEAKKFYGENSPEFKGLQNNAMKKILQEVVQPGDDPLVKIFDGKALNAAINKYGRETLEETFGKELTSELQKFANITQLVTQRNKNAGGIVAASVALHPLNNIGKIADIFLTTKFLRTPGAIKWVSEGLKLGDKAAAAGAFARAGAIASNVANDKTSSAPIDLNRPEYAPQ